MCVCVCVCSPPVCVSHSWRPSGSQISRASSVCHTLCRACIYPYYTRISKNHNSLGCKQPYSHGFTCILRYTCTVPPTSTDTSVFIRIYVHCTDIRKLRFIIRKTSSRRAPVHPRPRDERDYARPLPRGVSAAAAVRSLVSVVTVCRNLQMRATRVSLRSS